MRDKSGKKINSKEFFSRWKRGIQGITPFQQIKIQIRSTWITIIGLLCGIVISAVNLEVLWWLLLILVGGLGNTSVQIISLYQKRNTFLEINKSQEILLEDFFKELKGGEE